MRSERGEKAMIRIGLSALVMCSSACSVGIGSAYVGQWREHDQVAYEVCVENAAGECESHEQVKEHVPERKYWGFSLSYPALGAGMSSADGHRFATLRLESSAEFLKGKGGFAIGGRVGGVLDLGGDAAIFTVPVLVVAHYGVSERFSFYGGAGYSPFSALSLGESDEALTSYVGWRALAGVQIVGSRDRQEHRLIWVFEGDRLAANFGEISYRSWGLTAHLAISL